MSQTERLYWIDAQIRAERYPNARTVSQHFEVSERAAYVDRNYLLHRLGAPLDMDRLRGGWYYTEPTFVLPFLALSEREASALRRSLLAAREYLGPTDADAVSQVAARLQSYFPASLPAGHEQIRGSMHLSRLLSPELVAACDLAVTRRQRLELRYFSARRGEVNDRIVQPYELLLWRGEPHLIAFCEWRGAVRQFFLGRVQQWRLVEGEAAFNRSPDFDIEAYLRRGFGLQHGEDMKTVCVRFSPYQARWIRERRYHESQVTEELPDGGLLLTLRVAGTEEVRRWLLGYGAEVEVLEPAELRAEIVEELKKLRKIYGPLSQ